MNELTTFLAGKLQPFAGMTEEDIAVSVPYWTRRSMSKGSFYNKQNVVCKDLGIIVRGIFRVYHCDPATNEEQNLFFFSEKQFIVSFLSFIHQYPCNYYIEALEDAEIVYISFTDLHYLYQHHKAWEKFGRVLAENFFSQSQIRAEKLLFHSHEERYRDLLAEHPNIFDRIPSFHIASYLGIKNPSLSRIKKRIGETGKE